MADTGRKGTTGGYLLAGFLGAFVGALGVAFVGRRAMPRLICGMMSRMMNEGQCGCAPKGADPHEL